MSTSFLKTIPPGDDSESGVRGAENVPFGIWRADALGNIEYLSPSFLELLGITWEEAVALGWLEHIERQNRCSLIEKWQRCISEGDEWDAKFSVIDSNSQIHSIISKGTPVRDKSGTITHWAGVNLDISRTQKPDDDLKEIQLHLARKHKSFNPFSTFIRQYGDLTEQNKQGEILSAVGKEMLLGIAGDFMELLETSAAVFEKNGCYALNLICSPWCRKLDQISRESCMCSSNEDALKTGQWHCHESRWNAAKTCISTGQPNNSYCSGGIHQFSIPIRAGTEIIGAIVLGAGNPPRNPENLHTISQRYCADYEELQNISTTYQSTQAHILDFTINRLFFSARLIGTIVERQRAETAFHKAYAEVERRVESRTAALSRSYELLREETRERMRAEQELFQRHAALESVYSIATIVSRKLEDLYERVIQSISSILQIPYAALGILKQNEFSSISQMYRGQICTVDDISPMHHPCGIITKKKNSCQFSGDLNLLFPEQMNSFVGLRSYFGVPICSNSGELLGVICAMDLENRVFTEYEFHQIEIFSRYIAREIEQRQLEKQLRANQEMKMLGLLTSGVAHEVRNPLNGILAITEALDADLGENPEYSPYINHIRNQVNRLSDLMRDLLDLGRPIEKTSLQPSSIPALISKALLSWRASSKHMSRQIVQTYSPGAQDCIISADKAKMQQVFINLLENAFDHSSPSSKVTISVENGPENQTVIIKIIDQGSGMKEEHLEHLFEPFFTTRKGGTGLGLGIVKRIIESHDGSINLYNNIPPPGCTVEICLHQIDSQMGIDENAPSAIKGNGSATSEMEESPLFTADKHLTLGVRKE